MNGQIRWLHRGIEHSAPVAAGGRATVAARTGVPGPRAPQGLLRLIARVERINEPATARSEDLARSRSPSPRRNSSCRLCCAEQELPLSEGENVIGRTSEATVRISSSRVSRRHARIVVTGGRAVLEDLGSKNGTYLRGHRIQEPVELSDGDEICFGRDFVVFRFCYPEETTVTDGPP